MPSGRVEFPQSWNRYSYTLNNPLRYLDLLGMQETPFERFKSALKRIPVLKPKVAVGPSAGVRVGNLQGKLQARAVVEVDAMTGQGTGKIVIQGTVGTATTQFGPKLDVTLFKTTTEGGTEFTFEATGSLGAGRSSVGAEAGDEGFIISGELGGEGGALEFGVNVSAASEAAVAGGEALLVGVNFLASQAFDSAISNLSVLRKLVPIPESAQPEPK